MSIIEWSTNTATSSDIVIKSGLCMLLHMHVVKLSTNQDVSTNCNYVDMQLIKGHLLTYFCRILVIHNALRTRLRMTYDVIVTAHQCTGVVDSPSFIELVLCCKVTDNYRPRASNAIASVPLFHSNCWTEWPLTLTVCTCMGHDPIALLWLKVKVTG